jgi:hypothetical protein
MSNVRNYTTDQLLNKVKSLPSFKAFPQGYWILGVRSNEDEPNKFDDKFYIFRGEEFIKVTSGTTNPGTPILKGGFLEYNKVGAAVVKSEEWYYGMWKYGLHRGKMPALVQVGECLVYRDGDKDAKSEEIGKPIKGLYGINFHSTSYDLTSHAVTQNIGTWSAGCAVCNNIEQYKMIINMIKNEMRISYCLINEF